MPYNSYKDKLFVKRVNYNFVMKVHLYYNEDSKNRSSDDLPMFYLVPIQVTNVEKVAFSKQANSKGYSKYGNRFWRYKSAKELSNEQIQQYFVSIKNSYPYGFSEGDVASKLKYDQEVKFNKAFQSFYKKYWFKNLNKVKQPKISILNNYATVKDYPFPYIEYTVNEIITTKFPKGQYNPLPNKPLYGDYQENTSVYSQPSDIFCERNDIDVFVKKEYRYDEQESAFKIKPNLYLKDYPNYALSLGKNKTYFFHLESGEFWPTGAGGVFSGYSLNFSTGEEGVHNGFQEYSTDIQKFEGPSPDVSFTVSEEAKTNQHPYFSQGSISGYRIDATSNAPTLNLTRGNKYIFIQTGSSYDIEHPIYIATNPIGEDKFIYSKGVSVFENSGERTVEFSIPYDAPDTLYYACTHHAYMGGALNISNPEAHPTFGNLPGHVVKAKFNVGENVNTMYYYINEVSGAGGAIYLSDQCPE